MVEKISRLSLGRSMLVVTKDSTKPISEYGYKILTSIWQSSIFLICREKIAEDSVAVLRL